MKGKRRHFFSVGIFCTSLLQFFCVSPPSYAYERDEKIKAAYLFRLSLFVDWPETAISNQLDSINFCIAENKHFYELVNLTLQAKNIDHKPVKTSFVELDTDLSQCHTLYIPSSVKIPADYLSLMRDKPVLTIGESKKFFLDGGMIYLLEKNNRIRFAINHSTIKKAGLGVRAQLLKLAIQP